MLEEWVSNTDQASIDEIVEDVEAADSSSGRDVADSDRDDDAVVVGNSVLADGGVAVGDGDGVVGDGVIVYDDVAVVDDVAVLEKLLPPVYEPAVEMGRGLDEAGGGSHLGENGNFHTGEVPEGGGLGSLAGVEVVSSGGGDGNGNGNAEAGREGVDKRDLAAAPFEGPGEICGENMSSGLLPA